MTPSESRSDEVLENLLRERWSCRAFLPDRVPDAVIERMLSIAQRAPSWCNTQPWHVEVTAGEATDRLRRTLRHHVDEGAPGSRPDYEMPRSYEGIYQARRRATGWALYDAVGVARGDREASARQSARNVEFFDAPHVAIVTVAREQAVYGAVDAGIYVGALLLAAEAVGVAAIAQAAIAHHAPFLRSFFGLDAGRSVLVAVSFGYADHGHPANSFRTTRAALPEAVRFHTE